MVTWLSGVPKEFAICVKFHSLLSNVVRRIKIIKCKYLPARAGKVQESKRKCKSK